MRLDRSELSKAVKTALSVGAVAAVGVAGTAFAQNTNNQKKPQTLQTVTVVGSHIRSVELATSNPVVTVTSQQIEATGKLTIGAVIQRLPVITGGVQNPTINNAGGTGGTFVGLRGLGSSRTLVLVDGQRIINNDLDSIPTNAVERIEVLTDGASAIYGSDAIGGVINIILKSNYQGAQFQYNYGISDRNDGERKGASFIFGQTSDKGSIMAGVNYNKQDAVSQAARPFSNNPYTLTATKTNGNSVATANSGTKVVIGGSSFAERDRILGVGPKGNNFGCAAGLSLNQSTFDAASASPTTPADYHCFGDQPGDGYNFASANYILTPTQRTNAFFKGVYHLSDNVDFYGTYYHNKTTSNFQLAPAVLGSGLFNTGFKVSKDSYYNPFGVDFSESGASIGLRTVPAGDRVTKFGTSTDQLIMGFKGDFDIAGRNWTWNVGYDYGHVSTTENYLGLPSSTVLNAGAGPSFLNSDGVVQCGTAADPISLSTCTPFNAFNLNTASAKAAFAAAASPSLINDWSIERYYHIDFSGGLVDLPGGEMQLAFGGDYRKEYDNNAVGGLLLLNGATGTCILGSECGAHLQGGYSVKEAYAELFIPILKDVPGVHFLSLDLGERYSKYSDFGSTSNYKIGLQYRPVEDLLLRGTVARVFRAPSVGDIFSSPVTSAPQLQSDPCDHITTANPACQFVPTNGTFVNQLVAKHQQLQALTSGSAFAGFPLGPEKGNTFDLGFVYSPHQVQGLSFHADLWRIYLNDTITAVGAQQVLNLCFAGVSDYCPLIHRSDAPGQEGQLRQILQPTANLGRIDVKGLDFGASYRLPMSPAGQFTVSVNGTYMDKFKIQTAPGQKGNSVLEAQGQMGGFGSPLGGACPVDNGGICFYPRVRAQGLLTWQLGGFDASWTMRYMSKFRMGDPSPADGYSVAGGFDPTGPAGPYVLHYGAYVYNDVQVGYNIEPINTRVSVGVDNVMDKQPPMLYQNNSLNANTDPEDFNPLGRFYWARVTVSF